MRLRAIISIGNYEFCLYSLTNLPFCVENLIYKILNHISIHWLIVQIHYIVFRYDIITEFRTENGTSNSCIRIGITAFVHNRKQAFLKRRRVPLLHFCP